MKILDRYLLREFLSYLALGLAGFIAIFIVVDLIEKADVFLDHRAPLALVFRFYLYRAPEVVVQVMPVALLLATFLGLGQLNKFGELTAMRVSGLSLMRILAPVFGLAVVAVVVALTLGEFVVPSANRERDRIFDEQIQNQHRDDARERIDVTYLGRGGRIFYIRVYDIIARRMQNVSLVGTFTVDGREQGPAHPDRYDISRVDKVGPDQWRFVAHLSQGGVSLPVVTTLLWAGDTPMISMTDVTIPTLGTFTARVFFYGDRYAGTWQHGEVGGHMSGRIQKISAGGTAPNR